MTASYDSFLADVHQSCRLIEEATREGLPSYLGDRRARAVVEWRIYRIGELSNQLRDHLHEQIPAVPWRDIIRLRHRLAHHFVYIQAHRLFAIAVNEIPKLEFALRRRPNT
ncbi:MAG: DUF86 domain-containing protein [Actinomycetota bacterium]